MGGVPSGIGRLLHACGVSAPGGVKSAHVCRPAREQGTRTGVQAEEEGWTDEQALSADSSGLGRIDDGAIGHRPTLRMALWSAPTARTRNPMICVRGALPTGAVAQREWKTSTRSREWLCVWPERGNGSVPRHFRVLKHASSSTAPVRSQKSSSAFLISRVSVQPWCNAPVVLRRAKTKYSASFSSDLSSTL